MVLKPSAALAQQLDVLRSLDIGRSEGRVAIAVHLRYGDESFKVSFFNSKIYVNSQLTHANEHMRALTHSHAITRIHHQRNHDPRWCLNPATGSYAYKQDQEVQSMMSVGVDRTHPKI